MKHFSLIISLSVAMISGAASAATPSTSWSNNKWGDSSGSSQASRKKAYFEDNRSLVTPFSPGSHNIALNFGQVFLMGDHSENYEDALGAELHYTYGVSDLFGFDSSFAYHEHSEGSMSLGSLLTGLRTNLNWYDKVIPHAIVGMGFYRPSFQLGKDDKDRIATVLFGIHLGGGVDLQLSDQLFFGSTLTFHNSFGAIKTTSKGTLDLSETFTRFFVHIGATF